ncbi:hypothetical protein BC936DRAFT_144009 [Jimgerdemannia flammicorona]|uniref:Pectin lyase fold/virulence factor n=1 Tax=Jimgerdemannia flammicorona TaxID=994334 RepID=A0A433DD48_9FUNG|nr:hypothetical protein BC936DRAFT_144009 [Jimgerdemannia flammicorona]
MYIHWTERQILRVLALVACVLGSIQLACAGPIERRAAPVDGIAGYATLNGGSGDSTVTIKLKTAIAGTTARIVKVSGIINLGNATITVGSYKTILGVGSSSGFTNGGLKIKGQKNVIVRNLSSPTPSAPSVSIRLPTSGLITTSSTATRLTAKTTTTAWSISPMLATTKQLGKLLTPFLSPFQLASVAPTVSISKTGSPTLGYTATIDAVSSVSAIVKASSGTGKI